MTSIDGSAAQDAAAAFEVDQRGLVVDLEALAAQETSTSRLHVLEGLERSLRSGKELSRWADADLFAVLDVDGPAPEAPPNRSFLRSGALRTALVFAPVLMTWAGLLFAGRAYSQMVDDGQVGTDRSFLQLWLDGFGGRTAFSLHHVAELAVGLIAAAVAVSVLTDRRQRADVAAAQEHNRQYRQRLWSLAARSTLVLAPYRTNFTEQLDKHLARGVSQLSGLVAQIAQLHLDTERANERVASATAAAVEAAHVVTRSAQGVNESAEAMRAAVLGVQHAQEYLGNLQAQRHEQLLARSTGDLVAAISRMQDGCSEAVRESLYERDRILAAVETVTGCVAQLAADARALTGDFTQAAQQMGQSSAELRREVITQLRTISAASLESAEQVAQVTQESTATLTRQVNKGVQALTTTAAASVEQITALAGDALAEHIQDSTEQVVAPLAALLEHSQRLAKTAELALDSAGQALAHTAEATAQRADGAVALKELAASQRASAREWKQLSTRMAKITTELTDVPRLLQDSRREHAADAARTLQKAGQALQSDLSTSLAAVLGEARAASLQQLQEAARETAGDLQAQVTAQLSASLNDLARLAPAHPYTVGAAAAEPADEGRAS